MGMRLAVLAGVLAACAASADADWIHDMLLEECSIESRNRLEASVRRNIESSVRRAEASIEAPASIGDLGCLDGLMDVNIDVFASVGPLSSVFSNSLGRPADRSRRLATHLQICPPEVERGDPAASQSA